MVDMPKTIFIDCAIFLKVGLLDFSQITVIFRWHFKHKFEIRILDVQVWVQTVASLKSRNNTTAVLLLKRKNQVYIVLFFLISHKKLPNVQTLENNVLPRWARKILYPGAMEGYQDNTAYHLSIFFTRCYVELWHFGGLECVLHDIRHLSYIFWHNSV